MGWRSWALGICTAWLSGCGSPPGSPADAPVTRSVSVNGVSLVYESQGSGRPVVFVHGGFADHRIWDAQRAPVAAHGHRFVALTLRYFGSQPWPDQGERFSHETHVEDLVAFIRTLDSGPVVLVGRSYGAYTALVAALQHPELVRGLVLNEPPVASLLTTPSERAAQAEAAKATAPLRAAVQAGRNDEATRQFADWTNNEPGGFDALPPATQRMHLDSARTVPLQLATRNIPITCEQLARLPTPTVVTKGERSRANFRLAADAVHRCVPQSQLVDIAGARHGAPSQTPRAFNEVLLRFLAGL
jgi:pimeloyl-ACP methyl ester carboxylesterase